MPPDLILEIEQMPKGINKVEAIWVPAHTGFEVNDLAERCQESNERRAYQWL